MSIISFKDVTLSRGGNTVLSGITADIGPGEFIGLFGPNGAGKTTFLRALLGLNPPSAGTLNVFDAAPRRGNPCIGYVPQVRSQPPALRLSGRDYVGAAIRGHRWGLPTLGRACREHLAQVLETVDATAYADRPLSQLSGGERQRLLLAQALIGKPSLLLLDEPLVSLDLHYQQAVVDLVARLRETLQCTVLFTAHELNPLLGVMDRVLYLGNGRAVLGSEAEVITSDCLTRLFGAPIEVVRSAGRVFVMAAQGSLDRCDIHHHG